MRIHTRHKRALKAVLLSVATAASLLTVATGPAVASEVGGTITRAEVINRAKYWLNRGDTWYSQDQADAISDGDGHAYRPDCSGFVSMAWHMTKKSDGWDRNTDNFHATSSLWSRVGLGSLLPGDAVLKDGHMELFDKWVNADDHTEGIWTYGEHDYGRKTEHSRMSWSYLNANFVGLRYSKIADSEEPEERNSTGDYNGDGQTDRAVYRPSDGKWYIQYYRTNGVAIHPQLSPAAGDVPVPGDYNGDGQFDRAVWNPNGEWKITYYGTNGTAIYRNWGTAGDIPVPGDYNGDGQYDRAFYRPSDSKWYIQYYGSNGVAIHPQLNPAAGDVPVPGDYNGDGQFDRVVWNPNGEWKITYYRTNGTAIYRNWGEPGDVPVPGDYNGDGQYDRAVYRPADGKWYVQYYGSNGTAIYPSVNHLANDVAVPGDYNGDGQFDRAVWNPNGEWKIQYYGSNGTAIHRGWGIAGDIPVTQ